MSSLPYFPFYPADFEADTSHLTLEEDGAYNRLLRLMWMTPGCSLPDDGAWIARRMRADADTYDRVISPLLTEFFKRAKGRVYSPRLTAISEETNEKHIRRVEAGKKGGRPPKSLKTNDTGESNAKALAKQPEPEPEPELSKGKEEPKGSSKKPAARASQVPSDFQPTSSGMEYAVAKGMPAAIIPAQVEKFILHHQSKGSTFKDVGRAWQTWCLNYASFRPTASNVVDHPRKAATDVTKYHPLAIDMGGGWWTQPGGEVEWYRDTNECRADKRTRDLQAAEEAEALRGAI